MFCGAGALPSLRNEWPASTEIPASDTATTDREAPRIPICGIDSAGAGATDTIS
jgi:hypothetical protein